MKIVQIVTRTDNIGGAQVHVMDLAIELENRGHKVHLLVGGKGPFFYEVKQYGISVQSIHHLIRSINPYYDWRALVEIRSALSELKPDLVATHTSKAGWLGRVAAWSLQVPVVFTVHGWSFIEGAPAPARKIYILAEKLAGLVSSRIITVSEYDQTFCLKHHITPPHKVVTILNGIPDTPYLCTNQKAYPPRFIMTARLEKPKNQIFLLKALAQLTNYDWEIDLIGEGPLRLDIEQWISRLGLGARVRLLGARQDVPRLLKEAQGFILISEQEGLPISLLEAMRAGLPIIASDVGGVSETIEEGINGFLIPKDNADILMNRLFTLFSNGDLRLKMGKASREKYIRQFKIAQMVEKTLSVYSKVLHTKNQNILQ